MLPIFPKKIAETIANIPILYKIPIILGYYFPKYASTVVIWAKK